MRPVDGNIMGWRWGTPLWTERLDAGGKNSIGVFRLNLLPHSNSYAFCQTNPLLCIIPFSETAHVRGFTLLCFISCEEVAKLMLGSRMCM